MVVMANCVKAESLRCFPCTLWYVVRMPGGGCTPHVSGSYAVCNCFSRHARTRGIDGLEEIGTVLIELLWIEERACASLLFFSLMY